MSDPVSGQIIAGLLGAGVGAGGGIITNSMNINFQREVNAHNEQLMREAWQREDSAVQRRAADMDAAGFNPVLATGAAASSMPAVRAEAPRMEGNIGESAIRGAEGMLNIGVTAAQAEKAKSEARSAQAKADLDEAQRDALVSMPGLGQSFRAERYLKTWALSLAEREYPSRMVKADNENAWEVFKQQNREEIMSIRLEALRQEARMREAGAKEDEINAAIREFVRQRAEKDIGMYGWDKAFQYLGVLTGGFARVAGGAFMLDKIGSSGAGAARSAAADADLEW